MTDLSNPEKRSALAPRGAPYFQKILKGKALGFRKLAEGGTWVAREQIGPNKRHAETLGSEAELTYPEALAAALNRWKAPNADLGNSTLTIRVALSRYLSFRAAEKSYEGYLSTKSLFDCHVFGHRIADKPVAKCTATDYQAWFNELAAKLLANHRHPLAKERRRRAYYCANTTWGLFKAGLNHARLSDKTLPVEEWRGDAVKLKEGGKAARRRINLTREEAQRLINTTSGDFRDLVCAGLWTGARIGELKAMRKGDLDFTTRTWFVAESKAQRDDDARLIADDAALALLQRRCLGLADDDLVFTNKGEPWGRKFRHAFRMAAERAKLPAGTTFYALRHTHVSAQIIAGALPLAVAQNVGTSLAQIEKFYGHLRQAEKQRELAKGRIALDVPEDDKVVAIRG